MTTMTDLRVTTTDPRHIEECPPFPAPWKVESWITPGGETMWSVWAADQRIVIQPTPDEAFCRAIVRSRNEGTAEEDMAYARARFDQAIAGCRQEIDHVRTHFQAEIDKVLETNRRLQDAIVEARAKGSTEGLPAWCQSSEDEPEPGPQCKAARKPRT
jgi:hypothetical protein